MAIQGDEWILTKQEEMIDKYQNLAREIRSLWMVKSHLKPIVVGALGTILKGLDGYLKKIGDTLKVELLPRLALLGTARTLKMVLESSDLVSRRSSVGLSITKKDNLSWISAAMMNMIIILSVF